MYAIYNRPLFLIQQLMQTLTNGPIYLKMRPYVKFAFS